MCLFIKEFITNPFSTGAIASSSQDLARLMIDTANLENQKTILEIGSGTGVFTEKIYQKMNKCSNFFVIELNPSFAKATKKRCPEIDVFNDSASNIRKYLNIAGLPGCNCIVSSLPWSSFSNQIQEEILNNVYNALLPSGIFVTYVYIHNQFVPSGIRFKNKLIKKFGNISKTNTIWRNIPPAFVYFSIKQNTS